MSSAGNESTARRRRVEDGFLSLLGQAAQRRGTFLQVLAIAAITAACYFPSLGNGFIWDDDQYIYENQCIQTNPGIFDIWFKTSTTPQYYPVVFTSFWLEHKVWGLNPFGYHLTNLLLHIASAIVLLFLIRRLLAPAAFATALFFAIHPVNVETVAWASERKNVLAVFFYLLAIGAYLKNWDTGRRRYYAASLIFFVLALLSKSITVSFVFVPFFILVWQQRKIAAGEFLRILPFVLAGLAAGLNTVHLEMVKVGALGREWDLGILEKMILPGKIILFYLGKILFPSNLTFFYERWVLNPRSLAQWLPSILVVVSLLWLLGCRKTIGWGPFLGLAYYVISLFPALGFFNVYPMRFSFVADHFQYLSTIPILLLLVGSAIHLFDHYLRPRLRLSGAVISGIGYLVLLLGSLLLGRVAQAHSITSFRDDESLWLDVIRKNDKSWAAHNNLGLIYLMKNDTSRAELHFKKALALAPHLVTARNNLGLIYYDRDQLDKAIQQFNLAFEANPNYARTYHNLALVFQKQGDVDKAVAYFERAITLSMNFAEPRINLGRIHRERKRYDKAIPLLEEAIETAPQFLNAFKELGLVYEEQGHPGKARAVYERGLKFNPGSPVLLTSLGNVNAKLGRIAEAVSAFTSAIQASPTFGAPYYGLARLLRAQNRNEEAAKYFVMAGERGVELQPDEEELARVTGRNSPSRNGSGQSTVKPADRN